MKKLGIALVTMLAASQSLALTPQWTPIVAIGGGITNTINLGKSKNFPIVDPIEDEFYNYSPSHKSQTKGLGELFLAVETPLCYPWFLQAGFAYTQPSMFNPEGTLTQGADASSQNQYHYQYDLVTRQLMLQSKWMYQVHERFYPYALIGLGAAINTASEYTTTIPSGLTFTRLYAEKTITSFAYRVGLGVDVDLGQHFRAGIAYRFADIGGSRLGRATINNIGVSGTLSQSAIYANEVLAQLTWRI